MILILIFCICLTLCCSATTVLSLHSIFLSLFFAPAFPLSCYFFWHFGMLKESTKHEKKALEQVQVRKQQYASKLGGNWDFNAQGLDTNKLLRNCLNAEMLCQTSAKKVFYKDLPHIISMVFFSKYNEETSEGIYRNCALMLLR